MLSEIAPLIRRAGEGENLSVEEVQKAFTVIAEEDTDGYYLLALLLALHSKGETADELLGFCKSELGFIPRIPLSIEADKLIDVSGTGGGTLKTLNVSTAAAFVVAAAGVTVAKQAFVAGTGLTGSADVFHSFGIDIFGLTLDEIRTSLEETGICPYRGSALSSKLENRTSLVKRIYGSGLAFPDIFHLAALVPASVEIKKRVYGCFSEDHLRVLAELFQKLGYNRGMVVHGLDGLDEISNVGPTKVLDYTADRIEEYILEPEDIGIPRARADDIRATSKDGNIIDFLRVLYGLEHGAKRHLVVANAAVALYVMETASTIRDGVHLASSLIDHGEPSGKIEELTSSLGDMSSLEEWKNRAGISIT